MVSLLTWLCCGSTLSFTNFACTSGSGCLLTDLFPFEPRGIPEKKASTHCSVWRKCLCLGYALFRWLGALDLPRSWLSPSISIYLFSCSETKPGANWGSVEQARSVRKRCSGNVGECHVAAIWSPVAIVCAGLLCVCECVFGLPPNGRQGMEEREDEETLCLLAFTFSHFPGKYSLCCHWIWQPAVRGGATSSSSSSSEQKRG